MNQQSDHIAGLRTIVVEPVQSPQLDVVLLHGYAMLPEAISPFAHSLGVSARFLLPEGPVAADPEGQAWWHIDKSARDQALAHGPRDLSGEHPRGVPVARAQLVSFLREVQRQAAGRPLALVGFSQGGMLACDTFLHERPPVRALALLSSSRIAVDEWTPLLSRLKGLPVFVSHGIRDADLAFSAGEALRDLAASAGAIVTWVPFEGGHEIPLLVWRSLRKFLLQLVRAS